MSEKRLKPPRRAHEARELAEKCIRSKRFAAFPHAAQRMLERKINLVDIEELLLSAESRFRIDKTVDRASRSPGMTVRRWRIEGRVDERTIGVVIQFDLPADQEVPDFMEIITTFEL